MCSRSRASNDLSIIEAYVGRSPHLFLMSCTRNCGHYLLPQLSPVSMGQCVFLAIGRARAGDGMSGWKKKSGLHERWYCASRTPIITTVTNCTEEHVFFAETVEHSYSSPKAARVSAVSREHIQFRRWLSK